MSQWTTDTPTVPGWYWWRERLGRPAYIVEITGGYMDYRDGEWQGPIVPEGEE